MVFIFAFAAKLCVTH